MPVEIERKFLVRNDAWWPHVSRSRKIRQGYLGPLSKASVRVRIDGEKANLNIKSATLGMQRSEYEYSIPMKDAIEMLDNLCEGPQIDKNRHIVIFGDHTWEIDEFFGDNLGLIMAEIELDDPDERFEIPDWLGVEVTEDERYYNVNLVKNPYKNWGAP